MSAKKENEFKVVHCDNIPLILELIWKRYESEGWELVSSAGMTGYLFLFFKRPKA